MSKVRDHIHKLRRTTYSNGTKVYFCLNDCSYKIEVPFALGKVVECNDCGLPFKMNEYTIKLSKPHCTSCGKIQEKDPVTGKRSFKPKNQPIEAMSEIADSTVSSLKDRLGKVVMMEKEEDI